MKLIILSCLVVWAYGEDQTCEWGACDDTCTKTYVETAAATDGGDDCTAPAVGDTAACDPADADDDACLPPVDCVGSYGACDATCTKTYAHDTPAANGGTECATAAGTTEACDVADADDDECAPIDCVGSYGACDATCTKTYAHDTAAANGGAVCDIDAGATAACEVADADDDECVAVDCVGSYGACDATCVKTYAHDPAVAFGGVACDIDAGATEDCLPADADDDACEPVPVDCAGTWGACNADCVSTYTINQAAENGGEACIIADGDTDDCNPEDAADDACVGDDVDDEDVGVEETTEETQPAPGDDDDDDDTTATENEGETGEDETTTTTTEETTTTSPAAAALIGAAAGLAFFL